MTPDEIEDISIEQFLRAFDECEKDKELKATIDAIFDPMEQFTSEDLKRRFNGRRSNLQNAP